MGGMFWASYRELTAEGSAFRKEVGDGCEKAGKSHVVGDCSDRLGCGHYLKLLSRGGMMIKATFKEKEPDSGMWAALELGGREARNHNSSGKSYEK